MYLIKEAGYGQQNYPSHMHLNFKSDILRH